MSRILKTWPWPVIALILGFLCPTELSLYLGGLRLPPYRIILLVVVPIALWKLCFAGKGTRLKAFDYFFFAFGAWIVFSFSMHPGDAGGIEAGGSQALDCIGGYLIARVYIRTIGQFVAALKLLSGAVIVSGLIALPELFTGRHFAHEIMRAITGIHVPTDMGQRFGLTRAYGTFDHPIHLGTFSCALFAVFWYAASTWTGRLVRGGLVAVATLTAISSAPILGLLLQCGLIVWDMATRAIKGRVVLTIGAVVLALLTVSALSSRSVFTLIATYLTLNPWTGYYRLLIWENGIANVMAHPWIGIGLADWLRPIWMVSSSIDAFWLVTAMRNGVPAIVLLVTAITLLGYGTARVSRRHPDMILRRYAKAWFISLTAMVLVGCTFHFWNVLACFFFFFLGLAGWIADPAPMRRPVAAGNPAITTNGRRRRRRRKSRRRPVDVPGTLQPA